MLQGKSELLGKFFCDLHDLDMNKNYDIEYIDAVKLFTSERLDLIPKIKWLSAHDTGRGISYAKYLYVEHIKAITGRSNIEGGKEEEKNSIQAFEEAFVEIEKKCSKCLDANISVIPVDKNNVIMDGAHRTAVGIYHHLNIPIVRINKVYPKTGAEFFMKNLMGRNLVENMVSDYCKINPNKVYAVCLWPKAKDKNKRQKVEQLIREKTKIIYKKEVKFSANGLRNFIIQIYYNFNWLGGIESNFAGAYAKVRNCWVDKSLAVFYFVEGPELGGILKLKQEIRDLFENGKDSVHITDNNTETIQVAELILNKNSIDLLNSGSPDKFKKINYLIEALKKRINAEGGHLEDYIIDSNGTLAIYGLLDTKILPYLGFTALGVENADLDFCSASLKYHNYSLDDLIYNPDYHLYYNGVKFVELGCARLFMENRREKRDFDGIRQIDSFRTNKFNTYSFVTELTYNLKRYSKFYTIKLKMKIKSIKLLAPAYDAIKRLIKG